MDPHNLVTLVGLAFLAKVVHDAQMDTEFMNKTYGNGACGVAKLMKMVPGAQGAKMVPLSA